MNRIRFDLRADFDLIEIELWLADVGGRELARQFREAVGATITTLAAMPGLGAPRQFRRSGLQGLRSWPVRGFGWYLLLYRAAAGELVVLRVLHGARDLDRLMRRPDDEVREPVGGFLAGI